MSDPHATRLQTAGLAIVGLGASIAPLDFSVNIAFPAITAAFGLETRAICWVAVALFDENRRTWALSMYGGMAALAGVIAPIAGGVTMALLTGPRRRVVQREVANQTIPEKLSRATAILGTVRATA